MTVTTGPYPSRTHTYAPGDQIASNDLNAIQDGIVGCSDRILTAEERKLNSRTASGNLTDSPAPDTYGGHVVWVERSTNGTNVVVLDDVADWRDRFITVNGRFSEVASYLPGGADDDVSLANSATVFGGTYASNSALQTFQYTGEGWNGISGEKYTIGLLPFGWSEHVCIFARAADGALCMVKSAHAADPDVYLVARVECSPVQNHY